MVLRVRVLIDTWWNVNVGLAYNCSIRHVVLIDTWWNVNVFFRATISSCLYRFNRYMVECEYITFNKGSTF